MKFKEGKIYEIYGAFFEVTKRTPKFVTLVQIQHLGRFNERRGEPKRCKIYNWKDGEVVFTTHYEIHASEN